MTDFWADRIKLNPKLEISTSVSGAAQGGDGTLDSRSDPGMSTETLSPSTMGRSKNAPSNPCSEWSAGPDNND